MPNLIFESLVTESLFTAAFCGNEVFLQVKNCESLFFLVL